MLDQERCILCSRCVRFGDEITKTNDFGIFNRGDHAEINVYPEKELNNKYSGNVVDICPVGALTDKDFRFKMRVWYLGSQESVCPGCSRGCNINIEYEKSRPVHLKNDRVMRLKPRENPEVNQWWICDEGRYAYKSIDQDRLTKIKEAT
jgi:NADH-quinone oxidoreductase subunit G